MIIVTRDGREKTDNMNINALLNIDLESLFFYLKPFIIQDELKYYYENTIQQELEWFN